ncbi:MAG: hypothetical protein AAFQ05_15330, partial [Pseudomonadota bacterium]
MAVEYLACAGHIEANATDHNAPDHNMTEEQTLEAFAFIPGVGGLLMTLVAFVIALSVIVAIHEYGHYIVG